MLDSHEVSHCFIVLTGTAFTDTVCVNCMEGTYSNGSLTTCQPHSMRVVNRDSQLLKMYYRVTRYSNIAHIHRCESEGLKEIKPGTMSSDVECGKSVSVSIIVGVIAAIIIGVLVTAVGIIYCKLKQKRGKTVITYTLLKDQVKKRQNI